MPTPEHHRIFRSQWLRAAVLGANDGIVSIASLILGVAAAQAAPETVLTAGLAGLVSGALAMAAGEYVSVCSQADTEAADLRLEQQSLTRNAEQELAELTDIYIARGVSPGLARQVASQLTRSNALDAHARDELGIVGHNRARPVQAALASASAFASGAALPLGVAASMPLPYVSAAVVGVSLFALATLGAWAAGVGGAPKTIAAVRVTLWGALAMGVTAAVGAGVAL